VEKERIAVRCPNMGMVSAAVTGFCCMLERISADPKCRFDFDTGFLSNTTPWDFARNQIVDEVLKDPRGFSRLWFLDSDIIPSPASLRLLLVDADIAAGPYPIWGKWGKDRKIEMQWSVYEWDEAKQGYLQPDMPDDGVLERDGAGTGMMIIRRRVLEDPRMSYPREYVSFTGQRREFRDIDPNGVFCNRHKPNGQFDATEDLDFCYRAKNLGYTLKVDYAVKCGHIKSIDVLDVARYSVDAYENGFRDALESMQEPGLIEVAH
jgi:hypothetical protein